MELFFRKYFWVVNLVFLLATAFLTAKTTNTFLGGMLSPKGDANAAPPPTTALSATGPTKVPLSAEAVSKVTGIELPKVEEKAPEEDLPPALPDIASQEPVKSGLRVKLLATTVSLNHPEWSIANIEDVSSHVANVYMIGDKLLTAEIIDIELKRVIVNNNGRKEYIDNEAGTGEAISAAQPPTTVAANTAAPPSSATGAGIKAVGEDSYEIPKDEINKALSNLNDIAMQARIVPAFKDGVATGFKLFSIRPDSLYTKIGIQNGDIIRRINGFEINSPDKALEVYTKLKESNRIEIELDRNGSAVRKKYDVK